MIWQGCFYTKIVYLLYENELCIEWAHIKDKMDTFQKSED